MNESSRIKPKKQKKQKKNKKKQEKTRKNKKKQEKTRKNKKKQKIGQTLERFERALHLCVDGDSAWRAEPRRTDCHHRRSRPGVVGRQIHLQFKCCTPNTTINE
jgi:hypothetical protein